MRSSYVLWMASALLSLCLAARGDHSHKLSTLDLRPHFASASPLFFSRQPPPNVPLDRRPGSFIAIEANCVDSRGVLYQSNEPGYQSCQDEINGNNPVRWREQQTVGIAIRR